MRFNKNANDNTLYFSRSSLSPLSALIRVLASGGGRRDRTDDPLLAKQVLSQLSYAPRFRLMLR